MWQLVRLFLSQILNKHLLIPTHGLADNTCSLDNFPQSGQIYKTNTSMPKTLTSDTIQCQVDLHGHLAYLASTPFPYPYPYPYPMDPTQQIIPWILLPGEWCYLMYMHWLQPSSTNSAIVALSLNTVIELCSTNPWRISSINHSTPSKSG